MEEVLSVTGTGVWRWELDSRTVAVDETTARLFGLPPKPAVLPEAHVRDRCHALDYAELTARMNAEAPEGGLVEGLLRVVNEDGEVVRTLRLRARAETPGPLRTMLGLVAEVPGPPATSLGEPRGTQPADVTETGDGTQRAREAFLLDAGRALAQATTTAEVLRVTASLSMPGFTPSGLAVFKVEGDHLVLVGYHGYEFDKGPPFETLPLSAPYPGNEVLRTGHAVYIGTVDEYQRRYPASWPLVSQLKREAWAYLPLVVEGRAMGLWMVSYTHPVRFAADERAILTTISRMLARALSVALTRESERALSAGLRKTMLPWNLPEIPGMSMTGRYVPTGGNLQVGGDWFDLLELPGGRFGLIIGDVQGHDIESATTMAQLRIALRAYAAEGHSPSAVLSRASRFLSGLVQHNPQAGLTEPRFATCLYAEFDPASGTFDFARAGHLDPAVRLADGTLLSHPVEGGLPLGLPFDGAEYPTTRLVLEPGQTLLVCTDGLLETGGHDLETGWLRLAKFFQTTPLDPATSHLSGPRTDAAVEALADGLLEAVNGPSSHRTPGPLGERREDDIAFVLLYRRHREGRPKRPTVGRRAAFAVAQSDPRRIADARNQLRGLLHDWADADRADSAVLMLSEALTNALVHTEGDALAAAEISGEPGHRRLRVEVADRSDELPHRRSPGEMASSGRGLTLLEALADSWGVDPRGEGKTTWFEVAEDVPAPSFE